MPMMTNPSQADALQPAETRSAWVKVAVGLLVFSLLCFAVYLFSPYTRIQALICSGNYYYSPQQVYALANLSVNNRTFIHPTGEVEKKLESNPLIESADVTMNGQNLSIVIQEKTILGYYEKDGANYLVSSKGERIPVENETELRTLVHFPLLADLSDETIDRIAQEVQKHPDLLTREVFEKIAEILPWEESYDKNMLKLVLQDGNTVFTSIPSLFMMSTYQQVLSNLQGESVCLVLDGDNGVVNKVACDYMYLSPEKRAENREIPKSILTRDMLPEGSDEAERKALEEKARSEAAERGESVAPSSEQASSEQPAAQPPQTVPSAAVQDAAAPTLPSLTDPGSDQNSQTPEASAQAPAQDGSDPGSVPSAQDRASITDWEPSAMEGMQHSPSTGLFHQPETDLYYTYDEASDTFYPVSD